MQRIIVLSGNTIEYEFERKRVKNLNLRIRHDGGIYVSAPNRMPLSEVEDFLRDKSDFILNAVRKTHERIGRACRPVSYTDGETVGVWGDKCTLRVLSAEGRGKIVYDYPNVYLYAKDKENYEERRRIYERWKRDELQEKILEMCEYYYPRFEEVGVKRPQMIKFRTMSSKWGCCRPDTGILTFNYNLFEVPEESVAYVVVHEFAHFLEANHSDRFYAQVARVMPDWRPRRKLLNEY